MKDLQTIRRTSDDAIHFGRRRCDARGGNGVTSQGYNSQRGDISVPPQSSMITEEQSLCSKETLVVESGKSRTLL